MSAYKTRFGLPDQRWPFAKNVGSVLIPPWGVVEIATSSSTDDGHVTHHVRRPTAANLHSSICAINGPSPIAVNGYGNVTQDYPAFALYNTGNTPAVGESWGTAANAFTLTKNNAGFLVTGGMLGAGSLARVRVHAVPPPQPPFGVAGEVVSYIASSANEKLTITQVGATDHDTSRPFYVYATDNQIIATRACKVHIDFHALVLSLVSAGSATSNQFQQDTIHIQVKVNGNLWATAAATFLYPPQGMLDSVGNTITVGWPTYPPEASADGNLQFPLSAADEIEIWVNMTLGLGAYYEYMLSEARIQVVEVR